jgi:ribonuclease Y
MSPAMTTIVIGIVFLIVGILIGYIYRKNIGEKAIGSAEMQAKNIVLDAQNTAENLRKDKVLEAKEEIHRLREDYEKEFKIRRNEVQKSER